MNTTTFKWNGMETQISFIPLHKKKNLCKCEKYRDEEEKQT